jgi:arginine decarboxylase
MILVPNYVFFTKGAGSHREELLSFELALREAGIERCNLVPVSSIIPPNCEVIPKEEGLKRLIPGQITYCVLSRFTTRKPGKIVAAIGYATCKGHHGYIAEHWAVGQGEKEAREYAESLAAEMLLSKQVEDIKAGSIASVATVENYTTVIAAAVFLF